MNLDHPSLRTRFAWLALGASLLATVLVSLQVKNAVEQAAVRQVAYASDHIALKIQERLAAQELILRGGAGLFASSDQVTREDWRRYWETLKPELILPGVQGFGFSQVIAPGQLPAHVAQVRREGFPTYAVRPAGARQAYSAIVYLEPFRDRNLRAFGYDMFSEPVRRAAMMQARDTGHATLTGRVRLVQEDGKQEQSGVLMYVPVYRSGMPTATLPQRQQALVGWAFSPYRMRDLMQGMLQEWHGQIGQALHLRVYDGAQVDDALLHSSMPGQRFSEKSLYFQQRTIDFNGRQWVLVFDKVPGSGQITYTAAWGTLAGGVLVSLLLFWLGRSLLNTRYHANRIAKSLTEDVREQARLLKESESRWQFALDGSGLGVWDWNITGGTVFYSRRWKEMLGYAEHEIGDGLQEWEKRVHPDDKAAVSARMQACLDDASLTYDMEHRLLCKDGNYIWVRDRGMLIARNADAQPARMIGTLSDITAKKLDAQRIQHLNRMRVALSECNAAILRCPDQDALFARVCEVVVRFAGMKMAWIGLVDPATDRILPVSSYGESTDYLDGIEISARAEVPQGRGATGTAVRENQPVWIEDFRTDRRAAPWRKRAAKYGWISSAALPLCRAGKSVGALTFYAAEAGWYDAEMRELLESMAAQISFALDKLDSEAASKAYQASVLQAGQRLQKVFEATPVPMQIHAAADLRITSLNHAHQLWLGYSLQEIDGSAQDFECAEGQGEEAGSFRNYLNAVLPQLRQGATVQSLPGTLHCKDGATRVATCTLNMVDQDVIAAWTDLTEVRRSEQALRDSEQRFRGMVEQTISGMYVRRDGRFIYVNPRLCEITGWSADELLGREVLSFTVADPENLENIHQAWARLAAGERNVAYSAPVRRKDGELIELGVNASIITWDDGLPATIVMAQDITARKRAENQIAAYVKQLEASMRGTLDAVSNMVELRDPYTAGHERRVGVIAAAIAREMGWSEERCDNMEMIGLVHDIGKIAVPSEILTKPGRLTPLEMELMKCHAQAGYDILKDVPFAAPVAQAIWQHHERMDGSGYPRGLTGDEILPEARVLVVADVIESMASHRPYRAALGLEVALAEVVRSKGTSYDAEVVEAAVRLVQDKRWVFP